MSAALTMPLAAEPRPSLWQQVREDVACVKTRDPAARYTLEIVLAYPGVHAVLYHRFASRLWRLRLRFLARLLSWFARLVSNVDIDHGAGVVIGETAEIGDDVTIYHGVTLGGTSWSLGKRHPTIENGVLIGAGAKILGPITIGRGVRVGANSVVIEDVPPHMTVVGIPGKVVRATRRRHRIDSRIDLEHHLMPDPVGDALAVLIDRIEFLEARLTETQHSLGRGRAVIPDQPSSDRTCP